MTGIEVPWGLLTGIRPVRKAFSMMEESGESLDTVMEQLRTVYLVSPEKLSLLRKTAEVQLPLLRQTPKRSVGFYISIPFCPTRCSYCSFVSHSIAQAKHLMPEYIRLLCRELEIWGDIIQKLQVTVDTIYFGGGTPTSISAEALEQLLQTVVRVFDLSKVREFCVEAGRPDTITREKLEVLKRYGVDRISVNPQTMEDAVLQQIGRKHTSAQIAEAFQLAREVGFTNINMDLIAGLPHDTPEGFHRTLEKVLALNPDSITVHTLTLKRAATLFSDRQAQAILEMRLYKLIGLEIEALMKEHDETLENIAKYEDILEHRSSMAKVIIKELTAFKKAYGKERKTVIDNLKEAVVAAKKIEEQDVVFLMDRFGYAKIVDTSVYERNKEAANAEYRHIFTCKNTDKICIFTDKGQMHLLKVLDLPYGKFRDKGTPIDNLCNYDSKEENVVYLAGLEHVSSHRMLFGTKYAMIKVVDGMEFVVAKKTTAATKLGEEDEVLTVCPLEENDTLVMATKKDMFLRIDCAQIPQKKKGAVGVRGMKLAAGDELKSIHVLHEGEEKEVEVKGKPVALHRLHVGNRDTKGVKK